MSSILTTAWTQLLARTNLNNRLACDQQAVCSPPTFYKLMDEMARIGWLRIEESGKRGAMIRKVYRITFEGALISEAFNGKL